MLVQQPWPWIKIMKTQRTPVPDHIQVCAATRAEVTAGVARRNWNLIGARSIRDMGELDRPTRPIGGERGPALVEDGYDMPTA